MPKKNKISSAHLLSTTRKILEKSQEVLFYTLPEITGEVLREIVNVMKAKSATLRLFDEEKKELVLMTTYGLSKDYEKKPSIKVGESIAGVVFQKGNPLIVEDLTKNKDYLYREFPLKEGIFSLISAPLRTPEKKLGVASIYFPHPKTFSKEEIDFFTIAVNFVSIVITNYELQEKLHRYHKETIASLILELESRLPYLKGHSEKVAALSEKIAQQLSLPSKEIKTIKEMAILHDIGKIIIDKTVLYKKGPLSSKERDIIKQHPLLGEKIVSPIKAMEPGKVLIRSHHERIDGKGYPDGLKGDSLPLLAKIIAVADAYDAMTSLRPYRNAYSKKKAIDELRKNVGRQFDEKIVNACLKIL